MVVRGGCEAIIHGVQTTFDVHLDWVMFQVDVTNVFSTISHKTIFHELQAMAS
jgi:hypothetical protein